MNNKHLIKESPKYLDKHDRIVTLLNVTKTDKGLLFTTKIVLPSLREGIFSDIGKWSQAYKRELSIIE